MKYYKKCEKILGNEQFAKLITVLLNGIIEKYGKEISIEKFVKILEININVLLMLGLSKAHPEKTDYVMDKIKTSFSYLIDDDIEMYKKKFANYIDLLAEKM